MAETSRFGDQLKEWRRVRGVSQLELANLAGTTPRYVSFIETGRSRPGKELILRLAESLNVPVRQRNDLLLAAGLAASYEERDLTDEQLAPYRRAVDALLKRHAPFPAVASDGLGHPKIANESFLKLFPFAMNQTLEESIDSFFGPGPTRELIENWAEIAWSYLDARQQEVRRTNHPKLRELTERALRHMKDVPRPSSSEASRSPVICPRLRMGDRVIRTFTTVMRFEHAQEVTMSELRVELIFPADEEAEAFFRSL